MVYAFYPTTFLQSGVYLGTLISSMANFLMPFEGSSRSFQVFLVPHPSLGFKDVYQITSGPESGSTFSEFWSCVQLAK